MISPEEIKNKAAKKYKDFLRYEIELRYGEPEEPFFPLIIRADTGSVNDDLFKRQKDLQNLISKSKAKTGSGYSLETKCINSRNNGEQTSISKIYFETQEDFLTFIHENRSYKNFRTALEQIGKNDILSKEKFCEWAKSHWIDLCSETESTHYWSDICLCVNWLNKNQNSNLYIREIPLSVHTKFIEQNKKIIQSLTEKAESSVSFEETFGLRIECYFVRFRSLSANVLFPFSAINLNECQIPIDNFKELDNSFLTQIKNIFIVENKMVYLTFPQVPESICIWGQGYKVNILNNIDWFNTKNIYYFGDLDEHGFDILSSYRRYYSNIQSFCMNKTVWNDHLQYTVEGKKLDGNQIPQNLTNEEKETFLTIRDSNKNRLEQERLSIPYIQEKLRNFYLI